MVVYNGISSQNLLNKHMPKVSKDFKNTINYYIGLNVEVITLSEDG
jgi:hypothetical protein